MTAIKKIGVFTSGGDAPGMNACIRSVVRTACHHGIEVTGVLSGYQGMIDRTFTALKPENVNGIVHQGGTILFSSRCPDFKTKEGRLKAYENLKAEGIDALVAIGGNGTFTGAKIFEEEFGIPSIGTPGTIDNDLYGTDMTIGFDTACNTVIEAIDRIRDTAASHHRLFFVEVMGRDSGYIALNSYVASDAEAVLIPERHDDYESMMQVLGGGNELRKSGYIVIVAEGEESGNAFDIQKKVMERFPHFDSRVTVLGHIQRGGRPTCVDRINSSRMGMAAVEGLLSGKRNVMAGIINNEIVYTSFHDTLTKQKPFREDLLSMTQMLLKSV
tara:strand:+ start:16444 stop:17430 length:987 start_codon:yes stop_codon:yes gene_type:complete